MKFYRRVIALSLLAVSAILWMGAGVKKDGANQNPQLNKTALQEWKFFDKNTINCTINSAGPYCDYLRTNSAGMEWPKGSGKTCIFTAGVWIIGVHRPTGQLRTAVEDYQTEFQPGPIFQTFNTTTNDPSVAGKPSDARYRLYKVNKTDGDLPAGSRNPDYDEWPGDLGAPYIDVNHNGKWDPGIDSIRFWGDQQLWCVYNDANPANHSKTGVTNPMGIEVQTTYFGFDQPGALGNMMFMRWKIINKSDADYDSVFIAMWADTDLGDANDDMAGIDTSLSLAYVYNGGNTDAVYGVAPPSDGFDFFEGPRVPGAPTDTALFEGRKIPGYRNLPAYAHAVYTNGGNWTDPPLGGSDFALKAYYYMNGLDGTHLLPYTDPTTGRPSRYVFSGDPVTNTGWLPKLSNQQPADVRSMMSAGPFSLAKGDTQEVVGGFLIARGSDNLNSVTLLRTYDKIAQEAFNVNFVLPSPPPPPVVTVSQMPNEAVLTWDGPSAAKTENYHFVGASKDYRFEGYNVYQGQSKNGPWKLLATYDVPNDGIGRVIDNHYDPNYGVNVLVPVAFGDDKTGIKRYFHITGDAFNSNQPLIDGKEYYFSVTAYAYNHDSSAFANGVALVLENSNTAITVVPKQPAIGDRFAQLLSLAPNGRPGDDAVEPEIVNPRAVTGSSYKMTFNGSGLTVNSWTLVRGGRDTVVANNTDFSGDDASPIVDGILFRVTNPPAGVRTDNQSPNGYRYTPSKDLWFDGPGTSGNGGIDQTMQAFNNGLAYPQPNNAFQKGTKVKANQVKKVQIRFGGSQKAYRYVQGYTSFPPAPPRDPSYIPYLIHKGPGFTYQDFVDVPFTVWEVDSLDGNPAPRQLNCGFVENNDTLYTHDSSHTYIGKGHVDGKWDPTTAYNGGQEILYIFASDYNAAPQPLYMRNPTAPNDTTKYLDLKSSQDSIDVMYILWVKALDTTVTAKNGDMFTISPNYRLSASSSFSIVAPQATVASPSLMKQDMARINVYPNPYFASNTAETSQYQRFVTFTNLPTNVDVTVRIYDLAGELVKTYHHNDATGFQRWDLRNENSLPVASGMYFAYIDVKGAGNRILKLAIIQPEERPTKL